MMSFRHENGRPDNFTALRATTYTPGYSRALRSLRSRQECHWENLFSYIFAAPRQRLSKPSRAALRIIEQIILLPPQPASHPKAVIKLQIPILCRLVLRPLN